MPGERLSRSEVKQLLGVSEEFLRTLERESVVAPDRGGGYEGVAVERVRVCWNLYQDLQVGVAGLDIILRLLDRLEQQRRQFREVLCWLERELRARER